MTDSQPKIQDEIQVTLNAQKLIVHDTVRVNVAISAQVDPTQSEADFRGEIQSTLRKFIDTEWKIQAVQRSKGNKYESVYVNATSRVDETENYQLTERANSVSRIGFELINPSVDYSLSFDQIQDVNQELRLALLNKALIECASINKAHREAGQGNPHYRLSSTRFDHGGSQNVSNAPRLQAYGVGFASAASASPMAAGGNYTATMSYEDEAAGADESESVDLNVSTRFSMQGTFVLRSLYHG